MGGLAGICKHWGVRWQDRLKTYLSSSIFWLGARLRYKEGKSTWSTQSHMMFIVWMLRFTDTTSSGHQSSKSSLLSATAAVLNWVWWVLGQWCAICINLCHASIRFKTQQFVSVRFRPEVNAKIVDSSIQASELDGCSHGSASWANDGSWSEGQVVLNQLDLCCPWTWAQIRFILFIKICRQEETASNASPDSKGESLKHRILSAFDEVPQTN